MTVNPRTCTYSACSAKVAFMVVFCAMTVYMMCIDLHENYDVLIENKTDRNDSPMLYIHIWLLIDQVYLVKISEDWSLWILCTFWQLRIFFKLLNVSIPVLKYWRISAWTRAWIVLAVLFPCDVSRAIVAFFFSRSNRQRFTRKSRFFLPSMTSLYASTIDCYFIWIYPFFFFAPSLPPHIHHFDCIETRLDSLLCWRSMYVHVICCSRQMFCILCHRLFDIIISSFVCFYSLSTVCLW